MTNTSAPALHPAGTRVRIVSFAPDYNGLTGVVDGDGTGDFADWNSVALDKRATARESSLLFRPQFLEVLPEPTVSLVKVVRPAAPAPRPTRQTAREQIAAVAAENGWTSMPRPVRHGSVVRYGRGDVTVTVTYNAPGAVTEGERLVSENGRSFVQRGYVWKRASGKRETVIAWLTEAGEQAPTTYRCELCGEDVRGQDQPTHMDERHTAPGQDPAGIPTVDEVADAIADGTWAAAPQAPEVVSVEILEAEADAQDAPSLDDAARDQALGSLDRLEEILPPVLEAAGSGYGFKALVRDHLLIVRGRIAELEAQAARMLDTALVAQNDWNTKCSRLNLRIAELEGRDAAAQEMLARAVTIERERDDYAATLVRVTDRNAELIAERDRIADLERETERLAGVDMAAAEAQKSIAELEAENERLRNGERSLHELRDDERIRGDRLAEQLCELRVQLAAALGMNVDHPIPTDGQLVRDVADLRAENARLQRRLDDEF